MIFKNKNIKTENTKKDIILYLAGLGIAFVLSYVVSKIMEDKE